MYMLVKVNLNDVPLIRSIKAFLYSACTNILHNVNP